MDAAEVQRLVEGLRGAGCAKVRMTFDIDGVSSVDVEFTEGPRPATPFVDSEGAPVNLDDGAGPLTRDPDDDMPVPSTEPSDVALEHANFSRKKAARKAA